MDEQARRAGEIDGGRGELAEGGRGAGEEVDRRQAALAGLKGVDDGGDPAGGVVDVGEVEGVLGAIDAQRISSEGAAREGRDDAVRVIVDGAVDVGEADDRGGEAGVPGLFEEALAGDLGLAVDVDGAERRVLADGQGVGLAVDLAAAGEDEPGAARGGEGRAEDVAGAAFVGRAAEGRVALAPNHAGDGGEVEDAVALGDGSLDGARVADVAVAVVRWGAEVEAADVMTGAGQQRRHRCADEAVGTRDQDAVHGVAEGEDILMVVRGSSNLGSKEPAMHTMTSGEMDVEAAFFEARGLYLAGKYEDARARNERIRQVGIERGVRWVELIGERFVGLCFYRIDRLVESEGAFRRALKRAEEIGCMHQRLLITNHLCSTLRRLGRFDEASDRFEAAIKEAVLPRYLHERCRLIGNYGALLDELGQRARADDCYSRYEELAVFLERPDRLANARGLAARSAMLRGDREIARSKLEDEARLAKEAGNVARQLAARIHFARLSDPKEALEVLGAVLVDPQLKTSRSRRVDALLAMAEAHEKNAEVPQAWSALKEVLRLCDESKSEADSHWAKRADAHHALARVAQRAGLHGEALYYLKTSINERHNRYRELIKNERIREMAKAKLDELRKLTDELVDEICRVTRTSDEQTEILDLFIKVNPRDGLPGAAWSWDEILRGRDARFHERDQWWRIGEELRARAESRWKEVLGATAFAALDSESQRDLVRADLSYAATSDDLARSAHLLVVTVERELRRRLAKGVTDDVTFGDMTRGIQDVLRPPASGKGRNTPGKGNSALGKGGSGKYDQLEKALRGKNQYLPPLLSLRDSVTALDGQKVKLGAIRNAVAHGRESVEFPKLSRLTVDAIKRKLVLEPCTNPAAKGMPLLRYITTIPA